MFLVVQLLRIHPPNWHRSCRDYRLRIGGSRFMFLMIRPFVVFFLGPLLSLLCNEAQTGRAAAAFSTKALAEAKVRHQHRTVGQPTMDATTLMMLRRAGFDVHGDDGGDNISDNRIVITTTGRLTLCWQTRMTR